MLWGYSNRTHGATGTLDPLMAKAVVLKAGDDSVAIVSLDLGRTPEESVLAKMREQTRAECGVSNLFITASHTHHAPAHGVDGGQPESLRREGRRADRRDHLRRRRDELVPVKIGVGRGTADLATTAASSCPTAAWPCNGATPSANRPSRSIANMPRFGSIGPTAGLLAVLFNYACHPVVMGGDNYQYSADYVGAASRRGREASSRRSACSCKAAAATSTPTWTRRRSTKAASRRCERWVARSASCSTKTARATATSVPAHPSIQFEARVIPRASPLGPRTIPRSARCSARPTARGSTTTFPRPSRTTCVPCTLTTLLIDGDLALVGMPGEIFVQFQTAIKTRSPVANSFLVGYTQRLPRLLPHAARRGGRRLRRQDGHLRRARRRRAIDRRRR